MFSVRIANSAKFLQMPEGAQLLYFHMVLRADDDGVVESYPLMKLLGSAPDNMKVLLAKGYVLELNEDQVVVLPDWKEHNTIRADRKVNSIYYSTISELYPHLQLMEAKPRSDVADNSRRVAGPSTVRPRPAQVKLSQGKISKENTHTPAVAGGVVVAQAESKEIPELIHSFEAINPSCSRMYGNTTQRAACADLIASYGYDRVKLVIEKTLPKTNALGFFPTITTPIQLRDKWAALEAAIMKHRSKGASKEKQIIGL